MQKTEIIDAALDGKNANLSPKVLLIRDVGRRKCMPHTIDRRTLSDKHIGRIIDCQRQAAEKQIHKCQASDKIRDV